MYRTNMGTAHSISEGLESYRGLVVRTWGTQRGPENTAVTRISLGLFINGAAVGKPALHVLAR